MRVTLNSSGASIEATAPCGATNGATPEEAGEVIAAAVAGLDEQAREEYDDYGWLPGVLVALPPDPFKGEPLVTIFGIRR